LDKEGTEVVDGERFALVRADEEGPLWRVAPFDE
jgi:hypothetical protein